MRKDEVYPTESMAATRKDEISPSRRIWQHRGRMRYFSHTEFDSGEGEWDITPTQWTWQQRGRMRYLPRREFGRNEEGWDISYTEKLTATRKKVWQLFFFFSRPIDSTMKQHLWYISHAENLTATTKNEISPIQFDSDDEEWDISCTQSLTVMRKDETSHRDSLTATRTDRSIKRGLWVAEGEAWPATP